MRNFRLSMMPRIARIVMDETVASYVINKPEGIGQGSGLTWLLNAAALINVAQRSTVLH